MEEQTLECVDCNTEIPLCEVCGNKETCDLCEAGYLKAKLFDAYGSENNVCSPSFCGLKGKGDTCVGKPEIANCYKSQVNAIEGSNNFVENCEICEGGYYKQAGITINASPNKVNRICVK